MNQSGEQATKSTRAPLPILRKDTLMLRALAREVYAMDQDTPARTRKRVRFEACVS